MVPSPSSFLLCVASCLQTPNNNRFSFFSQLSDSNKTAPLTEVLKAKAGDLYDLDCKQDVSFLVRDSFTPKRPAWAEDDDFRSMLPGKLPGFFGLRKQCFLKELFLGGVKKPCITLNPIIVDWNMDLSRIFVPYLL